MAAGGSFKNIFEKPVPEPLSPWAQFLQKAETKETSFDIFGEICHRVEPESASEPEPPSSPSETGSPLAPLPSAPSITSPRLDKSSSWNGSMTESDFLTFRDVVELQQKPPSKSSRKGAVEAMKEKEKVIYTRSFSDVRSNCSRNPSANGSSKGVLPPPITSIGRFGKPRVYFKSKKEDGRFVLREIRIPTQRLLQATREDGRLRMQVVGPVEEVAGREDEEKEEEEDEEEEEQEQEEEEEEEKRGGGGGAGRRIK